MVSVKFEIGGHIDVETLDDAMDILVLILEDNNVRINNISLYSGSETLTCKKK